MSCRLRTSRWREQLQDAEWRTTNGVAQLLVCGLGLAAWTSLTSNAIAPACVAGYSVGELAAIAAAGMIDAEVAIELAGVRAACMDAARNARPQAMLSIRGPCSRLDPLCRHLGLEIAIRIGPGHLIAAGPASVVIAARAALDREGLETRDVEVHIASHTSAMADAVPCFSRRLGVLHLRAPQIPVVCGLDGIATRSTSRLATALAAQLGQTVRWDLCMQSIVERRVRRVLEIGPGQALARLWNAHHLDIPARSVGEFASWQDAASWVAA